MNAQTWDWLLMLLQSKTRRGEAAARKAREDRARAERILRVWLP